ncbi:hypothetical protein FD755_023568, partial [Muntiacus reevesi]
IGKTSAGPGKGNVNTSIPSFWLLTLKQKLSTIHTILCHSTPQTMQTPKIINELTTLNISVTLILPYRKGLSIFAIILIISLCCIVFITMTYIMVCRKTSQQDHVYEVARFRARKASGSGETMRVALFASGCSSEEPASQTLDNDYSDEPCLGQEYQIITQINSDYACLLHTDPLDYELLATKGKIVC